MTPVPIFHGRVTQKGELVLFDTERTQRRLHLRGLAGLHVDIIVRKHREQRSIDQNAYMHAVPFPMLAEHFGDSIEGVKYSLMGECFGWKFDPMCGREVPVKPSTSSMSIEECSYFIEWLIPWALTTHSFVIPFPNEAAA